MAPSGTELLFASGLCSGHRRPGAHCAFDCDPAEPDRRGIVGVRVVCEFRLVVGVVGNLSGRRERAGVRGDSVLRGAGHVFGMSVVRGGGTVGTVAIVSSQRLMSGV